MDYIKHYDAWSNILAGLQQAADKTDHTIFQGQPVMSDKELTNIWFGEGLGTRIVQVIPDDMVRNWITIQKDTDGKISKEMNRLEVRSRIAEALYWARLYRGGLVVLGIDDGGKLDEPVNVNRVREIKWMNTYPAPKARVELTDIIVDPESSRYREAEHYTIYPQYAHTASGSGTFKVHWTRCLVFKGDPVPKGMEGIDFQNWYWGKSALQSIFDRVKNLGAAEQGVANAMLEFSISKMKVSGLAEILSSNDEEALKKIYNRMNVISSSKSIINSILLDADHGEDFMRDSISFAGISDMLNLMMALISSVTGIPVTKLFGISPGGLNATGESDIRMYYDEIRARQETILRPSLQRLSEIISQYIPGIEDTPEIEFNSIWQLTESEKLDNRKKQAEIDEKYINTGVYSADDVAESRFSGEYSYDTNLSEMPPVTE